MTKDVPSIDRRASLANELETKQPWLWLNLDPADAQLIIEALRAHLWEDVIGRHSGRSQHREWCSVSEWLYPGDEVVSRRKPV